MTDAIFIPETCRYCGGKIVLSNTAKLYKSGNPNKKIYLCLNCNAYVECHLGTDLPKGKVANTVLRLKRQETHAIFDAFWRSRLWSRSMAYQWLAVKMGLNPKDAHIGCFEMDECEQVITLCQNFNFGRAA